MKTITCLIGLFLLFLASPAKAQSDGDEIPWSINSGTMVGIGSYNLMVTQRIIDKAREIRSGRGSIIRASQIDAYDLLSGYPIVCQSDPLHPFIHYP